MFFEETSRTIYAFTLLYTCKLFPVVFEIPKNGPSKNWMNYQSKYWWKNYFLFTAMTDAFYQEKMLLAVWSIGELIEKMSNIISFSPLEVRYLVLASLLLPYSNLFYSKMEKSKTKMYSVVSYIILESLRVYYYNS